MNVLDESNKANMVMQGTTTALFTSYLHSSYVAMLPWFFAAIPLIMLDLKVGIKKANLRYAETHRPEDCVTLSRALRKTIDKSFSYICWIMVSTTLSIAFEMDSIKYGIMFVIYGIEVLSAMGSWLYTKGFEVNQREMMILLCKYAWKRVTGEVEEFGNIVTDYVEKRKGSQEDKAPGEPS